MTAKQRHNYPNPARRVRPTAPRIRRPSDKHILDNGGSVSYKGYNLLGCEADGKWLYYAKHQNGIDAVGLCRSVAAVKRFIDKERAALNV